MNVKRRKTAGGITCLYSIKQGTPPADLTPARRDPRRIEGRLSPLQLPRASCGGLMTASSQCSLIMPFSTRTRSK